MTLADYFKEAFNTNYWLSFHMFAGAFFSYLLLKKFEPKIVFLIILGCGFGWEVIEFSECYFFTGFEVYGTVNIFLADTFGDLVGELLTSGFVIWAYTLGKEKIGDSKKYFMI